MQRHIRHAYNVSKIAAGIILIIIGILAFFVPLIPGFILVILGFLLLGYKEKHIRAFWKKLKKKLNEWLE